MISILTVFTSFSSVTSRRTGQGLIAADWPGLWRKLSKEQELDYYVLRRGKVSVQYA